MPSTSSNITPTDSQYQVSGFHIDLSTINRGDAVDCPPGWIPLGMAKQEGNDVTILMYRETV